MTKARSRLEQAFYSPQEVATYFGVDPAIIRKYIRQGKIHAIKFSNLWRIAEAEVRRIEKYGVPEEGGTNYESS